MKYWKSAALLAFAVSLAFAAIPKTKTLCEGFVEENDMRIPVGDHSHKGLMNNGGITQAEYNHIMDRIQMLYGDVIKQKGGTLVINRLWDDATVNSSATQQGNQWIINMYGGIARHPDITYEGEALVACHETGHHLGGAPKFNKLGGTWAADEGGADYFATLKCLRNFFAEDDNSSIVAKATIEPAARSQCMSQYKTQAEQDLCMRISLAGQSVAYLFMDLRKETTKPQVATPDPAQVKQTFDDHPGTQCRMDTYFAGAVCLAPVATEQSNTDWKVGTCVQGTDAHGWRPRCWFSPDSSSGGNPGGGDGSCPLGDPSLCQQLCQISPTLPFCNK